MFKITSSGIGDSGYLTPQKVTLDKYYTVRTFIKEVRKRTDEWGYIGIKNGDSVLGKPKCKYYRGKLLSRMNKEVLDRIVIDVKATIGLTQVDYLIEI